MRNQEMELQGHEDTHSPVMGGQDQKVPRKLFMV